MTKSLRLPAALAHIVAEYSAQWTIMPRIAEQLLDRGQSEPGHDGPIVFREYIPVADDSINWIWMNPKAEDWARGRRVYNNDIPQLLMNPADWALDIVEQMVPQDKYYDMAPIEALCMNTNLRAMAMLAHYDPEDYEWDILSQNPAAIDLLRANPDEIYHSHIGANPAAESLIKELALELDVGSLQANPADWALDIFFANSDWRSCVYSTMSSNTNPRAVEQIREYKEHMDPIRILYNPAALDIILENPNYFPVDEEILANPAIFEPTIPAGVEAAIMYV